MNQPTLTAKEFNSRKVKPVQHESRLQKECVKWFYKTYPDEWLYAIPNGGKRGVITAAIMKAEGVKAGTADLCLLKAKGGWNGLYLEAKVQGNYQTEQQKAFQKKCLQEGYKYALFYSLEDFVKIITDYMNEATKRFYGTVCSADLAITKY